MPQSRAIRRSHGFTIIEVLIVILILALLSTVLLPMMFDSYQKARQKKTLSEMSSVGKGIMAWITDEVSAAAAGSSTRIIDLSIYGSPVDVTEMRALLVPQYISEVPGVDGWGRPYEYYLNTENLQAARVVAMRSAGRDGQFSGQTYEFGRYPVTDYDKDIVWTDGVFYYWPQGKN